MSNGTTPMPEAGQPVLDAYRVGQTLTVDLAPAEGRKLESTVQVTVRRAGTETVIDLVAEDAIQLAAQLILVAADATKLDQDAIGVDADRQIKNLQRQPWSCTSVTAVQVGAQVRNIKRIES